MSDVNFLNAYNEVILDNFNAVLKQNFLFQTQLKFSEERLKEISELQKTIDSFEIEKKDWLNKFSELQHEKNKFENELNNVRGELNSKNSIIENTVQSDNDRHRLQTALNSQAKELENLKNRITAFEDDVKNKQEYIKQLEEMLPLSKRKKLGIELEIEEKKEEVKEPIGRIDNVTPLKVESSGGTF